MKISAIPIKAQNCYENYWIFASIEYFVAKPSRRWGGRTWLTRRITLDHVISLNLPKKEFHIVNHSVMLRNRKVNCSYK